VTAEPPIWVLVISTARDVVVAGAVVFAAYTGFRALSTWRVEATWRENRDLARKVMLATMKVDDGFRHVRNPLQTTDEWPDGDENLPHGDRAKRRRIQEHIYTTRIEVLLESLRGLDALIRETEVVWGDHMKGLMHEVKRLYVGVRNAIDRNVALSYPKDDDGILLTPDDDGSMSEALYDHAMFGGEPNSFDRKIDEALESIRNECRVRLDRV